MKFPFYTNKDGKEGKANKVKIAREITKKDDNVNRMDLKDKVQKIIDFIRKPNK